jgi:hypothetical protein
MWFKKSDRIVAIRGKWRLPDGMVEERSIVLFGALKVVDPACVD